MWDCDICGEEEENEVTIQTERGWIYLCQSCYRAIVRHRLTGRPLPPRGVIQTSHLTDYDPFAPPSKPPHPA